MSELVVGGWKIEVDVARTRAAYATMSEGGWQKCGCIYCRNFGAACQSGFPDELYVFFEEAGINPLMDAEVYELGIKRRGRHRYGGEYYLWGSVLERPTHSGNPEAPFWFTFTPPSVLAQDAFLGDGALCLLFEAELPWVLEEEPEDE